MMFFMSFRVFVLTLLDIFRANITKGVVAVGGYHAEPGSDGGYFPMHHIFDEDIGFNKHPNDGSHLKRVNGSENAAYPGLVSINKCCPLGAFFDTEQLVCREASSSARAGNMSMEEIIKMERRFIVSHVRNFRDIRYYEFMNEIPPCGHSMVFTSQVTTKFTYDGEGPKLEGRLIPDLYCIDGREKGEGTVLLMCREPEKVCGSKPCIRKCNPYGTFFGMEDEGILDLPPLTMELYNLQTLKVDSLVSISHFGLYFGNECGGRGRQKLSPEEIPEDEFYLGTDGRLYVPNPHKVYYTAEEFCIEYVKAENLSEVGAFLCVPEETTSNATFYWLVSCFFISCVFLLATFLVYLFSPRSQNLYGKSLMCYVACLFSAYMSLAVIQLFTEHLDPSGCAAAAYSTLFFFLAAFFWLNIMSFDIWKTFRSVRAARMNPSSKEKVQFLWYSLYSWSMPSLLTGLCAAADYVPDFVPPSIKPDIGIETCWFSKSTKGIYLFFITPVSLVIVCNTVLYINTAWRCWKIKSEIIKMGNQSRKKYTTNKTQFIINSKLFVVMGIIWSLEVISFFFVHPIWYITDAANALHGVFIFVIFVLKRKVLERLPKRIRKPFIRMQNIKKKSTDDGGGLEDSSAGKRKFSRSSSTYVTDNRTSSRSSSSSRKHGDLNSRNSQFPSLISSRIPEENP
ncbi:UNVERIFIED_CONTAM: hypothetical protein PYX00_006232 [Menopon gallinae]|uniref:G-protein coupled receptors family 2 profile 2 domain-containing protein n=1 Tax=Menopon gallinae TaxID=328185 RepID=A0AAW2HUN3_9NEOP